MGDDLASYRWPGSQVIIDETKPGKLQASASVASHAGVRHVFLLHFGEDCVTSQRTSAWEASASVDTLIPKISSCWVFAIINQGTEQLEMCFTFIFLLFPEKWKERGILFLAGGGRNPRPQPSVTPLFVYLDFACLVKRDILNVVEVSAYRVWYKKVTEKLPYTIMTFLNASKVHNNRLISTLVL